MLSKRNLRMLDKEQQARASSRQGTSRHSEKRTLYGSAKGSQPRNSGSKDPSSRSRLQAKLEIIKMLNGMSSQELNQVRSALPKESGEF